MDNDFLEICEHYFREDERNFTEGWCKKYKPYWCKWCHSLTMLDRGNKFQCQLCGAEYECMDQNNYKEWRRTIKKEIMSWIK